MLGTNTSSSPSPSRSAAALRKAVSNWYLDQDNDHLAMQVVKYQSRDGWSHADVIALAHPSTDDTTKDAILRWVSGGMAALEGRSVRRGKSKDSPKSVHPSRVGFLPVFIQAFEELKRLSGQVNEEATAAHALTRSFMR